MRDAFSLAGRRALITGASRGIGRGIALAFAEAGADVTVAATDSRKLDDVAVEARRRGVSAHALAVDLADVEAVLAMVDQAHAAMGGLDVLVNNAAVHGGDANTDTSIEEFERLVNVNLRAPVFAAQRAGRHMRAAGGGVIINISSTAAVRGLGVYGAVKAGLESLTEGLAREWGPDGIRVVSYSAGTHRHRRDKVIGARPRTARTLPESNAPAAHRPTNRRGRRGGVPGVGCRQLHHGRGSSGVRWSRLQALGRGGIGPRACPNPFDDPFDRLRANGLGSVFAMGLHRFRDSLVGPTPIIRLGSPH